MGIVTHVLHESVRARAWPCVLVVYENPAGCVVCDFKNLHGPWQDSLVEGGNSLRAYSRRGTRLSPVRTYRRTDEGSPKHRVAITRNESTDSSNVVIWQTS